jgi:hypothetical protein
MNKIITSGLTQGPTELLNQLSMIVGKLDKGMLDVVRGQNSMAFALDALRLTILLIIDILKEKDIITEEEWKTRYQNNVVDKIEAVKKQMMADAQAAYQAAMTEAQQQVYDEQVQEDECTECTECNKHSDIVLPSERSEVKKF